MTYTVCSSCMVSAYHSIIWCLKMAITGCFILMTTKKKKNRIKLWWGQKKKNMLKWLLQHVGHVNIHLGLQKLKYVEPFDPNKNRNVSQCVYGKFRSNRILTSGAALLFFLCCWSFDHFSSQMSSINTKFKVIRDIQQTKKFFFIIAFDDEVFQAFNLCALTRKR